MTVCIATLCFNEADESPMVVVAADRMVTLGSFMEFEHANSKMKTVSPYALVLIAGDTLVGTRLAQEVCSSMAGTNPPIADVASALSRHYHATRQGSMEESILKPRGLDLASYFGRHASLNPQVTMMLDQQLAQFNLGVELLLAGIDPSGGHAYSIHNPGGPELQHDVIGYSAIGSGSIHALQAMVGFKHHAKTPFMDGLYRTYAAKRRSEVALGVGLDTDLFVISRAGTIRLEKSDLDRLDEVYSDTRQQEERALQSSLSGLSVKVLGDIADAGTMETPRPEPSEDSN
ncbi:MAG: hypothetical protein M5U23_02570 [Acidimicrobiia bacterium]|nr:hypothetical protein [Acidimicrobiia bacterium]